MGSGWELSCPQHVTTDGPLSYSDNRMSPSLGRLSAMPGAWAMQRNSRSCSGPFLELPDSGHGGEPLPPNRDWDPRFETAFSTYSSISDLGAGGVGPGQVQGMGKDSSHVLGVSQLW